MKKNTVLFFAFASLFVFMLSGCANSPAGPVALAENAVLDDFSDSDLTASFGTATGTWTASGDTSITNGGSNVSSCGAGSHMLSVTATVAANLTAAAGEYTTLVGPTQYGYVTTELLLSKKVDFLEFNNGLTFDLMGNNVSQIQYKVYFYSDNGNLCKMKTWTAIPAVLTSQTVHFDAVSNELAVPSGALYTVDSVLNSVKKVVVVFKYSAPSSQTQVIELYIDNVEMAFFPG